MPHTIKVQHHIVLQDTDGSFIHSFACLSRPPHEIGPQHMLRGFAKLYVQTSHTVENYTAHDGKDTPVVTEQHRYTYLPMNNRAAQSPFEPEPPEYPSYDR